MNPNLDDPNYDYFRTTEEKKSSLPRLLTDEYKCGCSACTNNKWRMCNAIDGSFEEPYTIRRRKPATQYPRWANKNEPPTHFRFVDISKFEEIIGTAYFDRLTSNTTPRWRNIDGKEINDFTHWLDIGPIPPPPKAEPEKDEFEEWWKEQKIKCGVTHEEIAKLAFEFGKSLASKESKEGGA